MPRKKVKSLRCPTCRKVVLRTDAEFPFCSDRCRKIDLGKWASGGYVVSSPIHDPDAAAEELEEQMRRRRADGQDDEKGSHGGGRPH